MIIEGDFGQGKSHVGRWAREVAFKRDFAVMQIDLDGQAISLTNPSLLTARLLGSLELPNGKGLPRPSPGLGVLLQEAGPHLAGRVPTSLSEFAFFLRDWQRWHADEELTELLELFLAGELSQAAAQRAFRARLQDPSLVAPSLKMNYGVVSDRVKARVAQLKRIGLMAEQCGAKGFLLIIDELDHDHASSSWKLSKLQPGLDMLSELAQQGPFVTLFLATPGITELRTVPAREVKLPSLTEPELLSLVEQTVACYEQVHGWSSGNDLARLFRRLWVIYAGEFQRLGWGPRFFVRAAVEACELAASSGKPLSTVEF